MLKPKRKNLLEKLILSAVADKIAARNLKSKVETDFRYYILLFIYYRFAQ